MTNFIAEALSEHPIFKGLPFITLNDMIDCATEKLFSRGSTIFLEGEDANYFYLILSGAVDLSLHTHNKGPIAIQSLHNGDILGWSWLFSPFVWHFDAFAREKTNTIRIDGKCIRKRCKDNPELGYELMNRFSKVMLDRLNTTRLQLVDIYG